MKRIRLVLGVAFLAALSLVAGAASLAAFAANPSQGKPAPIQGHNPGIAEVSANSAAGSARSKSAPDLTATPTPTTVCVGTTYQTFTSAGATMVPATTDTGIHCDDCTGIVALPFPVTVYGTPFTSAYVGSNGMLDFGSNQPNIYTNRCLPVQSNPPVFANTLFAYYDDLRTDIMTSTHGIYRATVGTAPNREFALRWHTTYFSSNTLESNFEVILHENSANINVIYGASATVAQGADPSSGIQLNLGQYTAYSCHTDIPAGTMVTYAPIGCNVTPTVTPTATPCPINFSDVHPSDYFYTAVQYLYCRGIISGYSDGTFRPYNNTTRAQLCKIIVLAQGWSLLDPPNPTFSDVPRTNVFYQYIETAVSHNIISGYSDGTFRPGNDVTRAQLSKIIVLARGWSLLNPPNPTFSDVAPGSPFYQYVETAYSHGIISGYSDGTFRPGNNATRGQISKIVYQAITAP
jgi:hypothetical protein